MNVERVLVHILLIAFILIITTTGFAGEDLVQSQWAAQPPTIDGQGNDWSGVEFITEKKVKVDYAVRNDGMHMYVLFVFKDPQYMSTVNHTGITIYFNTEGKEKKDHAYNFILKKITGEELIAYMKERGEVLTEQQLQSIKPESTYNVFMTDRVGKKDEEITRAIPPNSLRPGFKISRKGKEFMYEFRIPLAKSETSPRGMGVEPGQRIKIGFEWGGMTKELAKRIQAGGDISQEGRAGEVIDSRRTSGGAPSSASRRMPKKYDFWCDVKLAQSQ